MRFTVSRLAYCVAIALSGATMVGTAQAGAIISNGTVQLGVRDLGDLNQPGGSAANGGFTNVVGLRSVATNSDSTSPGCTCEGWGVGLKTGPGFDDGISGYANSSSGNANLSLVSFTSTASTARSVVNVQGPTGGNILRVTHDYRPLANTPYLYEVLVSIQNLTGRSLAQGELVYRRVMDWDIPRPGLESVSIQGVPAALGIANGNNIRRTDNNGFNAGDPFSFSSYGLMNTNFTNSQDGNLQGSIDNDQGALFDFEFEALAAGATRSFTTYYGAAPNVAAADLARTQVDNDPDVDIGLYSYGTCTDGLDGFTCDPIGGAPNTFIFGFGASAGVLEPPPDPDPGQVPLPGTLALLGVGLAALGGTRRLRR